MYVKIQKNKKKESYIQNECIRMYAQIKVLETRQSREYKRKNYTKCISKNIAQKYKPK